MLQSAQNAQKNNTVAIKATSQSTVQNNLNNYNNNYNTDNSNKNNIGYTDNQGKTKAVNVLSNKS